MPSKKIKVVEVLSVSEVKRLLALEPSIRAVSEGAGLAYTNVYHLYSGATTDPRFSTLQKVSDWLLTNSVELKHGRGSASERKKSPGRGKPRQSPKARKGEG